MRLLTWVGTNGAARLGALTSTGDGIVDVASAWPCDDYVSMQALIEAGRPAWQRLTKQLTDVPAHCVVHDVPLLAPLPRPEQIRDAMCFHKHIRQASFTIARRMASEAGHPGAAEEYVKTYQLPEIHRHQPVYYKANRFAVSGPDQNVIWPFYSERMDFELELAVIIGVGGRDISADKAMDHVFGFTIFNDFSARDAQAREMEGGLGPAKGKDFDGANVFGPCIVTLDEFADPLDLRMQARVNGETWCDSRSSTMDWSLGELIAHISRGETLYPGEIICSGTVGDGCGLEHDRYLNPGDVVELEIEGIGILRNRIILPEAC